MVFKSHDLKAISRDQMSKEKSGALFLSLIHCTSKTRAPKLLQINDHHLRHCVASATDHQCTLEYSTTLSCGLIFHCKEKNKLNRNLKYQRSQNIRTKIFCSFYLVYIHTKKISQIFHIEHVVILHQPTPGQVHKTRE